MPLDLILYLLAFGVLGGYSGLRIISGMSDAMMKKLEQEIEAKVNKTTQEFRDKLAKNMKDERSLKQDIEKYKDDHDLMKGAFLAQTGKSDDAIEVLLQQTQKHPDNHKGWMWLGHAYKNKQQYDKALECSTTAEKLAPEVWGYSYNCACYSSLSEKDEGTITSYLEESVRKFRKDERFPSLDIITELFKTDKDLAFIRDEKQVNVMDLLK
ncbi:tetratricopeptide repeat protein [Moritella viscosa]|uniref:tetratricopeptide repeat protein n=1 Tax=Moritella viscosa TaxID=80854 RepID=UPI00406C1C1F